LVARSVTWTWAPGKAAPFGSVTVPRILPRLVPCPYVADAAPKKQASRRRQERTLHTFFIRDSMNEELLTVTDDRSALPRVQEVDPGDDGPECRIELRFDATRFV
jgi:hypothetical protein